MTSPDQSRNEFEIWVLSTRKQTQPFGLIERSGEGYLDLYTQKHWEGWQAARRVEREAPVKAIELLPGSAMGSHAVVPAAPAEKEVVGMNETKIWTCKIGERPSGEFKHFPSGSDQPMRKAAAEAYRAITGHDPDFIFSGWGGELTEPERAVVENRLPLAASPATVAGASPEPESNSPSYMQQGSITSLVDALNNKSLSAESTAFAREVAEAVRKELNERTYPCGTKAAGPDFTTLLSANEITEWRERAQKVHSLVQAALLDTLLKVEEEK